MRFTSYPEYTKCTHPWLTELPTTWELKRLKYVSDVRPSNIDKKSKEDESLVFLCNYTDVYYNEVIDSSLQFMKATATAVQIERFALEVGDVVMTKDSEDPNDIGVPTLIVEKVADLVCGYHLALIRPTNCLGPYLKRVFDSDYLRKVFATTANGLTRYGLGTYAIKNALLPLPPPDEQQAIATFLDHETARIDTLIEKQQKLIALLKEKRQALISHAVTKGLDPTAPMKESGVQWLGEIPEHWDVAPIKHISSLQSGIAKGRDVPPDEVLRVPYIRVANVQDGFLDLTDVANLEIRRTELSRYLLKEGDVLMNEGGDYDKLGRGAIWNGEIEPCIHQNHVFAIRPTKVESEWLTTATQAAYAKYYFMLVSKQSTNLASISSSNLKEVPIVMPPLDERKSILKFISEQTNKIDALMEKAKYTVELLHERRTALISAAVTGKIDVRNHPSARAAA